MDHSLLLSALEALGKTLADRQLSFHIVVVGGSALLLAEGTHRPTQDVDVVAIAGPSDPPRVEVAMPAALAEAAEDVAAALDLRPDWLNTGPVGVVGHQLPDGYDGRLRSRAFRALVVSVPARSDLVRLKLLAAADEGVGSPHVHDLVLMKVSGSELHSASGWVQTRFPSGVCPGLDEVVSAVKEAIGE
jgi:hypothetical protein